MFLQRSSDRDSEVFNGVQLGATVHPEMDLRPGVSVQLAPSPPALPVWAGSVAHTHTHKDDREERERRERAVL